MLKALKLLVDVLLGAYKVFVSFRAAFQRWLGRKLLSKTFEMHHKMMNILSDAAKGAEADWALLLEAHNSNGPWHGLHFLKSSLVAQSTNDNAGSNPLYFTWRDITLDFEILRALKESDSSGKVVSLEVSELKVPELLSLLETHGIAEIHVRVVNITPQRALFLVFLTRRIVEGKNKKRVLETAAIEAQKEMLDLLG